MKSCLPDTFVPGTARLGWAVRLLILLLLGSWGALASAADSAGLIRSSRDLPWQQTRKDLTFYLQTEREEYTTLDRVGRFVMAVEGVGDARLEELAVRWRLVDGQQRELASATEPIARGARGVDFNVLQLPLGDLTVTAELRRGASSVAQASLPLRVLAAALPPQQGRIPLVLPTPPSGVERWPVQTGVPFPKGALWSPDSLRLVDRAGQPVPFGAVVRSRWGADEDSSIRWVGLDFPAAPAAAWWPQRQEAAYFLEYGSAAAPTPRSALQVNESSTGITVNTGPLRFTVRSQGFNLLDNVTLAGKPVLNTTPLHGPYLIDHKGMTYRASGDGDVQVSIEEQTAQRVVIRAAGWYVRSGARNPTTSATLPTDRLGQFITRIEAYADQPLVRVLHTWVLTHDTYTVRLRDVGIALPLLGSTAAQFGVEDGEPLTAPIPNAGVRLVQHRDNAFVLEDGDGQTLAAGARSAGWMSLSNNAARITLTLRDLWQRFPKELEATPEGLRLHIWPAHGKTHDEIDPFAVDQWHRLWTAHQGRELDMNIPWDYYLAVAREYDNAGTGVYQHAGHAASAIHGNGMGVAVTSDFLLHFAWPDDTAAAVQTAACFNEHPHALPDPQWTCATNALGWQHPYDPQRFGAIEQLITDGMRGYWDTQNLGGMFGMWIYRSWHHSDYRGDGKWTPYRLFNGTHHYEAFMPWLFYARSGDPFYLTYGRANIRQLSDVQMIHYDDPAFTHREFHSNQGRLLGSTRHDDSIAPWAGDHGVLGHLTCYQALMTAYYLTGDLRLREVVVDAWQHTLLTDRLNPQWAGADRSNTVYQTNPRDNANAVGELLDLYQLTYDPRILALLAPRLDIYLNQGCMRADWGFPLQNVLLFTGNAHARQAVRAAVDDYLHTNGKPSAQSGVWRVFAKHVPFALAGMVQPESTYGLDAVIVSDFANKSFYTSRLARCEPRIVLSTIADSLLYLPQVMRAAAVGPHGGDVLPALASGQPLPRGTGRWLRCVVRQDGDQPFSVSLLGNITTPEGVAVRVYNPRHELIAQGTAPVGHAAPWTLAAPGSTAPGEYLVFIQAKQNDELMAPVTLLPEVYLTSFWTGGGAPSRYYTQQPGVVRIQPHQGPGVIFGADGASIVAQTDKGEVLEAPDGSSGLWLENRSTYLAAPGAAPPAMAVTLQRWFAPSDSSRQWTPADIQ